VPTPPLRNTGAQPRHARRRAHFDPLASVERAQLVQVQLARPLGAGQVGKAVNQLVISGSYLSLAEGILVGQRAGLDPATLAGALTGGAAKSWVLENRWQRMAEDRYPLGFKVALHRKDLGIAIDLAKELGVPVPAATLVAQLEDALIAAGKGGEDLSALANQLRRMADVIDA
jgi:3-hydroxyisobutyrate dehydrogenase-like beta-hydroxyacid dehydrogenase